jgi:signal transduction histidine kinase
MNVIARDLETENTALRDELERTRMQLRRMEEVKRSFIALAADELRTPLTILFGYAKLLSDCTETERGKYAGIIATYSWQLKNTVDAIIALQLLDSGEIVLRQEPLPLAEIVQTAVENRRSEITAKALILQCNLSADLYVRADRERLALILAQLLSNSIKYSADGGTISVDAHTQQASIVVSIRDNGIGIPAEELPHVFERFYQGGGGDPLTRQFRGMGLGLAVAKGLVELHGGAIEVESATNQGSTFRFTLPRALPNAHVQPNAAVIQDTRIIR